MEKIFRFFKKIGGWREKEKAREESWGPPRESRPSEEREWDREKERERDGQDRDENDKDQERERDRERDGDREERFRRPRLGVLMAHLWVIVRTLSRTPLVLAAGFEK